MGMTHDKFCGLTDDRSPEYDCICPVIAEVRQDEREKVAQKIEAYCECPGEEALPECPCRYSYKLATIARGDSE